MSDPQIYDITRLAENGLRRGRTTGTCAAAAAKAAVLAIYGKITDEVEVSLPDTRFKLPVPIESVRALPDGSWRADVVKDAGDDPDATHGASIFCIAKLNSAGETRLFAGEGVGVVTQPGLIVPVGEPAINPVPRRMILAAAAQAQQSAAPPAPSESPASPAPSESPASPAAPPETPGRFGTLAPGNESLETSRACNINKSSGSKTGDFDLIIGCVNGEKIAGKTFNPRLGIKGGISILGTTGIVEPMSLAAYKASIEVYINAGLFGSQALALLPGNIGINFARSAGLDRRQIIHISNFIGFSLEAVERRLKQTQVSLPVLFVLGHPGKLAKVLDGHWDTHSKVSGMAMPALAKFAGEQSRDCFAAIEGANTVEAVIGFMETQNCARQFWLALEERLTELFHSKVPSVDRLVVRLFDMAARPLSGEASFQHTVIESGKEQSN